jgi:hypothetical protein
MSEPRAAKNLRARHRVRNGIFLLAALCALMLGVLRFLVVDPALLRIAALSAALLVVSLFMTYRAMATALDAGLAAERNSTAMDQQHDASSGALPPRPE